MILFLLCRAGNHTVRDSYLYEFPGIAGRVHVLNYEGVVRQRILPYGCYVFTDMDRAPPHLLTGIRAFRDFLETLGTAVRCINHPAHSLQRFELLRTLYEHKINDFDAYRLDEARRPERYPVFLRREDGHDGPLCDPLDDPSTLDQTIDGLLQQGHPRERLLAIEYCDVRDRYGVIRKYGAFYVNGIVVPRHVVITTHWVAKYTDPEAVASLVSREDQLQEEARYVAENPHADQIAEIFKLARIDYGRIDYSFRDGAIRVWEINTNPVIAERRNIDGGPRHRQVLEPGVRNLAAAILKLDAGLPRGRFEIAPTIVDRLATAG